MNVCVNEGEREEEEKNIYETDQMMPTIPNHVLLAVLFHIVLYYNILYTYIHTYHNIFRSIFNIH